MDATILLVPSPLLGPATWEPAAQALRSLGRRVSVADLRDVAKALAPYWPAGVDAITRAAAGEPVVLVPHSNAGRYLPAAVDALGEHVHGVVFVDAALPGPGPSGRWDLLAALAGPDDLLPPWTAWWDESEVAGLFPDDRVRARVEAEQVRMPLAYFDQVPPAAGGWDDPPCGYLWFSEPYGRDADLAAARGWPVAHLPGRHLHMLVDPEAVAAAVLAMAGRWT